MKKLIAILLFASPCYAGLITHTDYTSGNTITASGQNANENAIVNEFNGNIDNTNIKAGAAIAVNKLAATTANGIVVTDGSGFVTAGVNSVTSNSTFTITGLVTFSTITFSISSGGILGVTDASTANSGFVGEYISSTVANATTAPTNGWGNLAQITLTAGDWNVTGVVQTILNGATVSIVDISLSKFSGATITDQVSGDNQIEIAPPTSAVSNSSSIPEWRVSILSSTTIYLKANYTSSGGTPQYRCRISARRIR